MQGREVPIHDVSQSQTHTSGLTNIFRFTHLVPNRMRGQRGHHPEPQAAKALQLSVLYSRPQNSKSRRFQKSHR